MSLHKMLETAAAARDGMTLTCSDVATVLALVEWAENFAAYVDEDEDVDGLNSLLEAVNTEQ